MTRHRSDPVGVILAGGLARRMGGGDKPMRRIGGRPILAHVAERFAPQCAELILNANGDPCRFAGLALPVVADTVADNPGPLAGLLAALDWTASNRPGQLWVASVPGDCPFLPRDLVARLTAAQQKDDSELAIAASGGRSHPVIGLWPVALRDDLRKALVDEEIRKVGRWVSTHHVATVSWPIEPVDPFFNANTVEDLDAAEDLATRLRD